MDKPEKILITELINICGSGKTDCFECDINCPAMMQKQLDADIAFYEKGIPKLKVQAVKDALDRVEKSVLKKCGHTECVASWTSCRIKANCIMPDLQALRQELTGGK